MDDALLKRVKRTIKLLEDLAFINSEHWSDSDLKRFHYYLYHREPFVALEFFVNQWCYEKYDVLAIDSCHLIVEIAQRMKLDPDVYIQRFTSKGLWSDEYCNQ